MEQSDLFTASDSVIKTPVKFNRARLSSTGSVDIVFLSEEHEGKLSQPSKAAVKNFDVDEQHESKCSLCKLCCKNIHKSCKSSFLTENHPLSSNPSVCERFQYAILCPPHGTVAGIWGMSVALLFLWAILWSLTGKEALPGGNFFALLVLIVLCVIGGKVAEKLKAPPLLGMLLVGILMRNLPKVNVGSDIDASWSSALRTIALVVILTRAGLGLDAGALKKLSCGVVRLACVPCIVEAVTVAIVSHFILHFPWIWGFMLGFVLAAVSPAVVVPSMLHIQARGLGTDKGVPTLIIAAASLDDVLAITGFGVFLSIAFSTGKLVLTVFKGPLEAVTGVVYGLVFGMMCWYIPHKNHSQKLVLRFVMLFFGGLVATLGSRSLDISGAGALGCLTLAFIAGLGWKKQLHHNEELVMSRYMAVLWMVMQPLLFGLIGAEVDLHKIQLKTIGLGIAVLCIGLVFRCIAAFFAVFGTGLNWKEKLFIPFAWLPKATVQAAIGSVALDTARAQALVDPYLEELGVQLLTVAVLVIIITAPLGAIAISVLAKKLLKKTPPHTLESVDVEPPNT